MAIPKSKILYDNLVKSGAKVGTFDDFIDNMRDDNKRLVLYNNLKKAGAKVNDFNNFSSQMGVGEALPFYIAPKVNINAEIQLPKREPSPASSADEAVSEDVNGVLGFFKNIYNSVASHTLGLGESLATSIIGASKILPTAGIGGVAKGELRSEQADLLQKSVQEGSENLKNIVGTENRHALEHHYQFDLHNGFNMQDVGGVLAGLAGMAPEIAAAAPTGGMSFILPAYNNALKEADAVGLSPASRQAYALMAGTVMGIMNAIPVFRALDHKIVTKMANKFVGQMLYEALKKNGGKPLTKAAMEELLKKTNITLKQKLAIAGVKALKSSGEGALFGAGGLGGTIGAQKVANALEGKDRFVTDDFDTTDFLNAMASQGLMMAGLGAGSSFLATNTGRYIKDKLIKAKTDNDIVGLRNDLANSPAVKGLPPEVQTILMNNVDQLTSIVHSLPSDMPDNIKSYIMDLEAQKRQLQERNTQIQAQNEKLLPSLRQDASKEMEANQANVQLMDDKIREAALGKDYEYTRMETPEGIKFFKKIEGEEPQEISETMYDVATLEKDWLGYEHAIVPERDPNEAREVPVDDEDVASLLSQPDEADISKTIKIKQNENVEEGVIAPNYEDEIQDSEGVTPQGENQRPEEEGRQVQSRVTSEQAEGETSAGETPSEPVSPSFKDSENALVEFRGEKGELKKDGQRYVIETPERIYDIGNVDEIGDKPISEFGVSEQKSVVSIDDNGTITVRDGKFKNNFSDPLMAIHRDKDGNIVSVTLEREDGAKRTFRGSTGDEVAYNIILKELSKSGNNERFQEYLNTPEVREEIDNAGLQETANESAAKDRVEVSKPEEGTIVIPEPKTEENAVQEQGAGEGVLRDEGVPREGELPRVGTENTNVKPTEEGQPQAQKAEKIDKYEVATDDTGKVTKVTKDGDEVPETITYERKSPKGKSVKVTAPNPEYRKAIAHIAATKELDNGKKLPENPPDDVDQSGYYTWMVGASENPAELAKIRNLAKARVAGGDKEVISRIEESGTDDPMTHALLYFANGGRVSPDEVQRIFGVKGGGKDVSGERKSRISLVKGDAPSIERVAEGIHNDVTKNGRESGYTDQDYRDALIEVFSDISHPTDAKNRLIESADPEYRDAQKSIGEAERRFREMTGFDLTDDVAREIEAKTASAELKSKADERVDDTKLSDAEIEEILNLELAENTPPEEFLNEVPEDVKTKTNERQGEENPRIGEGGTEVKPPERRSAGDGSKPDIQPKVAKGNERTEPAETTEAKPKEERLKEAENRLRSAKDALKKAEDKIAGTGAEQSDMFEAKQSKMFAADRNEAKAILDPLRAKVKEAEADVNKIKSEPEKDERQTEIFSGSKQTIEDLAKGTMPKEVSDLVKEAIYNPLFVFLKNNPSLKAEDYYALREGEYDKNSDIDRAISISKKVRAFLEGKKINTEGNIYAGIPFDKIWNAAIKSVQKSLVTAEDFLTGVKNLIDYINLHFKGEWDREDKFNKLKEFAQKKGFTVDEQKLRALIYTKPSAVVGTASATPKQVIQGGQVGNTPTNALIPSNAGAIKVSKNAGSVLAHMRNVLSRNFSVVAELDKNRKNDDTAYRSVLRAAGSAGTARAWWNVTVRDIRKKALKGMKTADQRRAIQNFSKVMVQSILNGRKELYNTMSQFASNASDEFLDKWFNDMDFCEQNNIYTLDATLAAFSRFPKFKGLDEQASTLASNKQYDLLRALLVDAFNNARNSVKDLDWSEGVTYNEARQDPVYLRIKEEYSKAAEKLAQAHEKAGGFIRGYLGEENTYFPLRVAEQEGLGHTGLGILKALSPYFTNRKTVLTTEKAKNNQFATGFAEKYAMNMAIMGDRLADAVKVGNKNEMISILESQGYIAKWAPGFADNVIQIDGRPIQAIKIDVNASAGRPMQPKYYLVPKDVMKELNMLINNMGTKDLNWLQNAVNNFFGAINLVYLSTPMEAIAHGGNLSMRAMLNTPFVLSFKNKTLNDLGQPLGMIPFMKSLSVTGHMLFMNPHSEFWRKNLMEMSELGLIPKKYGSHTFSKLQAELTGAHYDVGFKFKKGELPGFGALLYGTGGLDIRARMMVYAANKAMNEHFTALGMNRAIGALGTYDPALQSQVVRLGKSMGNVAPFIVSTMSRMYNATKSLTGGNLALEGASFRRKAYYRTMALMSSSIYAYLGGWAFAYFLNTGKNPFGDPNARLGHIPPNEDQTKWMDEHPENILSQTFRNPKGGYYDFNYGGGYGNSRSAIRLFGLDKSYQLHNMGANKFEVFEGAAVQSLNAASTPISSSPVVQTMTSAAFGVAPYIISLNNEYGKPSLSLLPIAPPAEAGKQIPTNLINAAKNLGPVHVFSVIAGNVAQGFEGEEAKATDEGKVRHTPEEWVLQSTMSALFPQVFVTHYDMNTQRKYMLRHRKVQEGAVKSFERKKKKLENKVEEKRGTKKNAKKAAAPTLPKASY